MELRSLGYRTDLMIHAFDGEIRDQGSYLVVTTPGNPGYFWGNFLIFDHPPREGDAHRWSEIFKKEFQNPRIRHQAFSWDVGHSQKNEESAIAEFVQQGFVLEKNVVLAAQRVSRPKKYNDAVLVRQIEKEHEWETAIQILISGQKAETAEWDTLKNSDDRPRHSLTIQQWESFYRVQMSRYRKMTEARMGDWFGAFLNGEMVASLGLFHDGTLGRFQLVSTHPDFRRQGICGALVYEVSSIALKNRGLKNLVMIADEDYHAARIYESVGFQPTEHLRGVCRSNL